MSILATKVALQAVKLGTNKVPESVWDAIPGMRPPKEEREKTKKGKKDKERGSRHHHRRRSDGADDRRHRDEDKHRRSDERPRHRRRASSYSPHRSEESDSNSDREYSKSRRRRDRDHRKDRGPNDRSSFDRWDAQHQPAAPYSPPGTVPTYNPAAYPHAAYGQHVPHPGYTAAPPVQPIQSPPVTYASPHQSPYASRSASIQAGVPATQSAYASRSASVQAGMPPPQSPPVGIPAHVQASVPYSPTEHTPGSVQYSNPLDSRSASIQSGVATYPPHHGTQGPGGYAYPPPPPPPPQTAQDSRSASVYGPVPSSTAASRYTPGGVPPTNTAPQHA